MLKPFSVIILGLLCLLSSFGQEISAPKAPMSVFAAGHFGFVVPHRKEVRNIIKGHAYSLETSIEWLMSGKKQWHHEFAYPSLGVDFHAAELGNPSELGQQFSLSGFLKLPFNTKPGFDHSLELGNGIGYANTIWDMRDNLKGAMIGSHLNTSIFLQYNFAFPLGPKTELRAGLRIHHLSNGAITLPNLGTNNVSIFLGLGSSTNEMRDELLEGLEAKRTKDHKKFLHHTIFYGIGLKEILPPGKRKYLTHTISALSMLRISPKSSVGIGADFFYNSAIEPLLEQAEDRDVDSDEVYQVGISGGYGLHFGDWELDVVVGAYVRTKYKGTGAIYNRWGLKYYFSKHVFATLMLKSHIARADHPEVGFGWRF